MKWWARAQIQISLHAILVFKCVKPEASTRIQELEVSCYRISFRPPPFHYWVPLKV